MRREELVMDILGGLDDRFIAEAMPSHGSHERAADTRAVVAVTPVEDIGEISKKDRVIYWVTHSLGVAAAAFLIIGAAVLLIINWDKIAVREPDRPGVITTVSEPVVTSDSTITEPDKYDPFLYYSDMDMPEPFAQPEITEFYYGGTDGWHDEFYNLWKNDFYMIDDYLQKYVGEERAMKVISGYKAEQLADNQAGNITRYRIDDTQNWYRFAMDTGLTANDVRRARQMADENWSESPASMVQEDIFVTFGSKEKIAENNKTEYCISVGEYVFSPRWLYYHTTEDYKAAGITPRMINDMLEKYKTLGLTDEAWAAFFKKLFAYTTKQDVIASFLYENGIQVYIKKYEFDGKTLNLYYDVVFDENNNIEPEKRIFAAPKISYFALCDTSNSRASTISETETTLSMVETLELSDRAEKVIIYFLPSNLSAETIPDMTKIEYSYTATINSDSVTPVLEKGKPLTTGSPDGIPIIDPYDTETESKLGVSMCVTGITNRRIEFIITQNGGTVDGEILYTPAYLIEKKKGDKWEELPTLTGEPAVWNAKDQVLERGTGVELGADFVMIYGELPVGEYRICKNICCGSITETLYAGFIIATEE